MLVAPPLLGWAAAGGGPAGAGAAFALALLGAFLARTPLSALLAAPRDGRAARWLAAYSSAAAAGALALAGVYARWGLFLLAVPAAAALGWTLYNARRRRAMTESNELVGIAGLCLGAPGAFYAASGAWDARAAWVWLLCALFFAGPVFHVKMLVSARAKLPGAAGARRTSLAYHLGAAGAVGAFAAAGAVPAAAAVPFVLSAAKTAWYGARPELKLELKKVGWQEVGWTLVFLGVCGAGYLS